MGMLTIADASPATLTLLTLMTFVSAVLLPALLAGPSLVPAKVHPYVE
jgi:hypothetical protein